MRIIISRTDAIGDVILTLPMAGILKKCFKNCEILFLGKSYTQSVIKLSEHVNTFVNYDDFLVAPDRVFFLKSLHADVIIHVFPNKEIAIAASRAGIPLRIGTSHRLFHLFTCNKLIGLSRKNSPLHEALLNVKLLKGLGIPGNFALTELPSFYGFSKLPVLPHSIEGLIDKKKFNLILHPFSNASAREWPLKSYTDLIDQLDKNRFNLFVTGLKPQSKDHEIWLTNLPQQINNLTGKLSLDELIALIHAADGLLACSTGPLHIAAALNKYALGLYPPIRPMHAGRWGALGSKAKNLSVNKECSTCRKNPTGCFCMNEITVDQVHAALTNIFS